jgi:biotin operon repressor
MKPQSDHALMATIMSLHLQSVSARTIARYLQLNRRTVEKYIYKLRRDQRHRTMRGAE